MKLGKTLLLAGLVMGTAQAHLVGTHHNITSAAIQYLRENLTGPEFQALRDCLPKIEELVQKGTGLEDDLPGDRFMFHFYPELHDRLRGAITVNAFCDSVEWAFTRNANCAHDLTKELREDREYWVEYIQPSDTVFPLGVGTRLINEHTWPAAAEAAKSSDPKKREEGWEHLGYVLHLLQDLTSPAHTRSDGHPAGIDGDPMEARIRTPLLAALGVGTPLIKLDYPEYYFWELGDWTANNFYSKSTVFAPNLPGPKAVAVDTRFGLLYDGRNRVIAILGYSARIAMIRAGDLGLSSLDILQRAEVDEDLAELQWQELGPKAVLYTASLIYKFYQEVGKTTPCDGTCADISGIFTSVAADPIPAFAGVRVGDPFSIRAKVNLTLQKPVITDDTLDIFYTKEVEYTADIAGRKFAASTLYPSRILVRVGKGSGEFVPPYAYQLTTLNKMVPVGAESDVAASTGNGFWATLDFQGPLAGFEALKASPFPPLLDLFTLKRTAVFNDGADRPVPLVLALGETTSVAACQVK